MQKKETHRAVYLPVPVFGGGGGGGRLTIACCLLGHLVGEPQGGNLRQGDTAHGERIPGKKYVESNDCHLGFSRETRMLFV